MADEPAESPRIYAVRLTSTARRQIDQEHDRQKSTVRLEIADEWRDGIFSAIRTLATYPERRTVAQENPVFQRISPGDTLYALLYRRTRTGPAWRILFTVHEANENDPPTVRVQMLRHGAEAPMTFWPAEDE